jgi:hypothetical protein
VTWIHPYDAVTARVKWERGDQLRFDPTAAERSLLGQAFGAVRWVWAPSVGLKDVICAHRG